MPVMSIDTRIKLICPTLFAATDKEDWVAMAEESTSRDFYGDNYNQAAALMACHLFTLYSNTSKAPAAGERFGTTTGAISHLKEGDLTINFSTPASTDAIAGASTPSLSQVELTQTRYGVKLLVLRKSIQPFFGVTR